MTQQIFNERELPLAELEKIGLAKDGKLQIEPGALQALLAGRRTEMVRLADLSMDGFHIAQLDAKLSLRPDANGKPELLLHPIYKEAEYPEFLTDVEAEELQKGQAVNIRKIIKDEKGKPKDILVEYDPETREFIITDTEKIIVPDLINNEKLTMEQKERYRKGKSVELPDDTIIQFSGGDSHGIRSNKLALVASILVDGGLSFMLYKGLHALLGEKQDEKERARMSPGYRQALEDMREQNASKATLPDFAMKDEYSRGYSRSGISR
ncbi:DUF4099 domain-containing protein [Mucilaginibacter sp. PAMB04274]|uniref:DUF4099 domain-containing protein n=1 Tax=Mucilaginibacter sp. PAMB04274 TaxID=3138568 RepID=UPI0031F68E3D